MRQRRSVRTIKSYARSLERLAAWLKQNRRGTIRAMKWKDLRDYAEAELQYTYSSRSALISAVNAYWKYLGRSDSPAWAIPCPKVPRRIAKPLTREQLDQVLAAADQLGPRHRALCVCAYYLGIRREDLAVLRWAQFRRDGTLHLVGKGAIERSVPVVEAVYEALATLPRRGEYVFEGRWGGHIASGTVSLWVAQVSDTCGIPLWPHRFRHTAATNGYKATKDLFAVQEFLGHANAKTTRGYVEVAWESIEAVADAL